MGSVGSAGSGQKIREWAAAPQKLFGEIRLAVKPESARGFNVILVIGGLPLPAGKAQMTPCLPRSRASPLPSKLGSLKSGLSSANILVTKTVVTFPGPAFVIAIAVGSLLTFTAPSRIGVSGLLGMTRIDTVPSV